MVQVIDCKAIREKILNEVKEEVATLPTQPHLAVVVVGKDKASHTYVKNKEKTCEQVGIKSTTIKLPEYTTQEELETIIRQLNWHSEIHGVLLQLPLPRHLNEQRVIDLISGYKDVDGLTIYNTGLVALGRLEEAIIPCTPSSVIRMFDEIGYELEGKTVTIIGRSNLFGKPMAQLCLSRNATVKMCHSKTELLYNETEFQDVVISAIGKPKFLNATHLGYNEVLVDVGINRDNNGKLCGDIDIEDVLQIKEEAPKYYTPVPGGIGTITTAMLMKNVVKAYKMQKEEDDTI